MITRNCCHPSSIVIPSYFRTKQIWSSNEIIDHFKLELFRSQGLILLLGVLLFLLTRWQRFQAEALGYVPYMAPIRTLIMSDVGLNKVAR